MTRSGLARARNALSRTLGFSLAPAISILTPVLVYPVVSRIDGVRAVLAVLLGQSVGATGGTLVALGWPQTGPAVIARSGDEDRRRLYRESIETRLLAFVVVAPVCAVVSASLVGSYKEVAAVMAVAFAGYGFTSAWFYVGVGRARDLIRFEVLGRVAASALAALAILAGLPLMAYPALLVAAVLASLVLNLRRVTGSLTLTIGGHTAWLLLEQRQSTLSRFANGLYLSGAASIVAWVSPASAYVHSTYDRTQKSAFNAGISVPQSLVAWVASKEGNHRRQRIALAIDGAFGLVTVAVSFLAFPWVIAFLYGPSATYSSTLALFACLGIGLAILSKSVIMHGLLPMGWNTFAARMLTSCSCVGVVLVALGAWTDGAVGGLAGVAVTECLMTVVGLVPLVVRWRQGPTPTPSGLVGSPHEAKR